MFSLPRLSYFQEDAAGLDYPRMKLVQWGCSPGVCSCGRTWTDAFIGQPSSCSHQEKGMTNSPGSCTWRLQTERSNSLHERSSDILNQMSCVWIHTQNTLAHINFTMYSHYVNANRESTVCVYGHTGPQGKTEWRRHRDRLGNRWMRLRCERRTDGAGTAWHSCENRYRCAVLLERAADQPQQSYLQDIREKQTQGIICWPVQGCRWQKSNNHIYSVWVICF